MFINLRSIDYRKKDKKRRGSTPAIYKYSNPLLPPEPRPFKITI